MKCRDCGADSKLVRCPSCLEAFRERDRARLVMQPIPHRCGRCIAAAARGCLLSRGCPHNKPAAMRGTTTEGTEP